MSPVRQVAPEEPPDLGNDRDFVRFGGTLRPEKQIAAAEEPEMTVCVEAQVANHAEVGRFPHQQRCVV